MNKTETEFEWSFSNFKDLDYQIKAMYFIEFVANKEQ